MGIQGLIPFLEKSTRQVNISQYAGCTVAVDAYCWLHKGAFSCADKLARGDKTDVYVNYCMKYVNMLLSHNIKPILVFDGRHLPAKADTEKKRRQNREVNRRRAAELLRQDKPNEARTYLQRCVDVTHIMAVQLMRECHSRNVDCITAPYEADAQLAYLSLKNIAHIVITEDSDLLLFGCTRVMFKLDLAGNCLLVEQDRLHLAMGLSNGTFTMDKFRYMCILSGCDYLPSLPKIGLAKALRFVKSTVDPDIHRALSRLGGHLNMNITVPLEYRDKFLEADAMFRHQPVFDPLTRQLVPLIPPSPGAPPFPLLANEPLDASQLLQLAYGNLDPFTLQMVDDWSPEKMQTSSGQTNGWNTKPVAPHKSIWSPEFKPKALVIEKPDPCDVKRSSTSGKVVETSVEITKLLSKRPVPSVEEEMNALRSQFTSSPHPIKKPRLDNKDIEDVLDIIDQTPPKTESSNSELVGSPKKTQGNPFSKATPIANKFSGLSKLAQFRKTSPSETNIVQSRYFGQAPSSQAANESLDGKCESTLKDLSNVVEKQTKTKSPQKSPFAAPAIDRLTDSSISLLIDDLENDSKYNKDNDSNRSDGKENKTERVQVKRETNFRWRPSLAEAYGFKSKTISSSPAVNNKFTTPTTNESCDLSECSEKDSTTEVHNVRRNPFAKAVKFEDCQNGLCSQGSSMKDSQSDILTPETTNSEDSVISPPKIIRKPQMKVGLSKKTDKCQKSLLTMFAFKPKPKLQR